MTEYEAVSLFYEMIGNLVNILFGYISILSAFLIMSYFAAGKLNGWLLTIVLSLFSFACLMFIAQFNFIKMDMQSLYRYIIEIKTADDTALSWFGNTPAWTVRSQTILQNLVTIGGYFGCIVFFVFQRTLHKKANRNMT